jgi:hypothetical protein
MMDSFPNSGNATFGWHFLKKTLVLCLYQEPWIHNAAENIKCTVPTRHFGQVASTPAL